MVEMTTIMQNKLDDITIILLTVCAIANWITIFTKPSEITLASIAAMVNTYGFLAILKLYSLDK